MSLQSERTQNWQQLVTQGRDEFAQLEVSKKVWLADTWTQIGRLQCQLD